MLGGASDAIFLFSIENDEIKMLISREICKFF